VRELLTLTYPKLLDAVKQGAQAGEHGDDNKLATQTLLRAMSRAGNRFGGVLAAIGNRFLGTPPTERGSIFSTASAQTDFLESLPLRDISRRSDFNLGELRSDRPTTIYLCLPVVAWKAITGGCASSCKWLARFWKNLERIPEIALLSFS